MAHVAEQVAGRDDAGERWQLAELLQLLLPPSGAEGDSLRAGGWRVAASCESGGGRWRGALGEP